MEATKRKQVEAPALAANERLRLLVATTKDYAIYTMDQDGRIDYWNAGAQALFGYTESEIIGQPAALLFTPEDRESSVLEHELREANERGSAEDERWHVRKDGTRFYASGILTLLPDERGEGGSALGYAMIARDLTERRAVEESTGFKGSLLDGVEQSVIATNLDGVVIYWNQFAQQLYGWTAQEAIGRHIMELTTPEVMAEQALEIMSELRLGKSWTGEFKVRRRDGTTFPVQIINSPINDQKGTLIGIVGVSIDITEAQRQQASLVDLSRQLERQARVFDTTLSSITDFAYIFDREGRFLYANQALLDLWGLTLEEAAGKNFFDLRYPDDLASRLQQQIQQVFETHQVLKDETPYTSPTGAGGYYEYIFTPVFAADGTVEVVAGSTRDITEHKQVETALRDSRERLQMAMHAAKTYSWELNLATQQVEWSNNLEGAIGFTLPTDFATVTGLIHPEDRDETTALIAQAITGGGPYESEFRLVNPTSGEVVWVRGQGVFTGNADGSQQRFVGITQNITERKQAEEALRLSRAELQRSNDELERRVGERTAALTETNAVLQEEVKERLRIEAERVELLRRLIFAQEDERRRIAREMHDQFGQGLSVLTLKLAALKRESGHQANLREQLEILEAVAKQLDADVDFLVWELRPTVLDDLGLPAALEAHVQNWSTHFGIPAEFHVSGLTQERLPSEIETVLYRITQEALNNIAKYALARKVDIILEHRDRHVSLIIEDDGVGFDCAQAFAPNDNGLGLIGMRERAALVGGTLEIESQPDEGATVFIRIQVPPVLGEGEQRE
ncbi:MAG: PAS domain S-box protein [Pyrinomonadaceae bacterium]